ncbi:MAG TPA: hypothetical protein PLD67_06125 [Sedimentibacter sp.]|jgi:hypothetical protein|nr:hypothetical protein [Sedimentibacter sp.]
MKDKYLVFIIVLFVIAILYGLWPLYCKFNPAQNKLNTSVEAYKSMMDNFRSEDSIKSKKIDYINKINKSDFRSQLSQEKIISVLYTCALKNNIRISDIKFVETDDAPDGDIDIIESKEDFVFETRCLIAEFKAGLGQLLQFIDEIKSFRDISVINLDVSIWEEDIVFAFVHMKFYAVPVDMNL